MSDQIGTIHGAQRSLAAPIVIPVWTGQAACSLQGAVRMSQEAFAGHLGVGVRTVAKWHAQPEMELRSETSSMLDTLLDRLDDNARRRFTVLVAGIQKSAADTNLDCQDWLLAAAAQSSMDALSRTGQVGAEVLPDLVQHVMQIARGYDSESRTLAFKHAQAMRELASGLADTTRRPGELADIYLALGQLNALMASLAFDLASWDASAQLARAATRYADLAGHASLNAWTLGLEATLAFWAGDGHHALERVNIALALAPKGAPRYRVLHIAARVHAVTGNAEETRRALESALIEREVMDTAPDELHDTVGGEFAFGDARAAACAGAAWLRLGRGTEALEQTRRSMAFHLSGTDPAPIGVLHGATVDSVAALLLQGDVVNARYTLSPVLQLKPDPVNASLGGRLRSVAAILDKLRGCEADLLRTEVSSWLHDAGVDRFQ